MNTVRFKHIENAHVISEESMPLSDGSDFIGFLARQADRLSSGNRGSWVTEALVLAGYDKNKTELRQAYKTNRTAIDRYFEQVDVQQVINDSGPAIQQQITIGLGERIKNNVPGFLAGTIVAAGSILAIKKIKNR